jgi:hypothetical protein
VGLYLFINNCVFPNGRLASYLAIANMHRSLDIFIKLTGFAYNDLKGNGVGYIYGVANDRALKLHKRFGSWRSSFQLNRIKIKVFKKINHIQPLSLDLTSWDSSVVKFINWRFVNFTGRNYKYLNFFGVNIVVKIWTEGDLSRLHLMYIDWKFTDNKLKIVIDEIYRFAEINGCTEIDFWCPDRISDELATFGYVHESENVEVISKSLNGLVSLDTSSSEFFAFGMTDSF